MAPGYQRCGRGRRAGRRRQRGSSKARGSLAGENANKISAQPGGNGGNGLLSAKQYGALAKTQHQLAAATEEDDGIWRSLHQSYGARRQRSSAAKRQHESKSEQERKAASPAEGRLEYRKGVSGEKLKSLKSPAENYNING